MKKLFILCFSVFFIKNTAVAQEKDRVKYSYVAFSLLRNDEKGVSLSKDAYLNFAFKKQFPIVSQDLLYPGLTLEMAKQAAASGLYNAVAEGLVTSINKMNREENFYYTNGINTYVNAETAYKIAMDHGKTADLPEGVSIPMDGAILLKSNLSYQGKFSLSRPRRILSDGPERGMYFDAPSGKRYWTSVLNCFNMASYFEYIQDGYNPTPRNAEPAPRREPEISYRDQGVDTQYVDNHIVERTFVHREVHEDPYQNPYRIQPTRIYSNTILVNDVSYQGCGGFNTHSCNNGMCRQVGRCNNQWNNGMCGGGCFNQGDCGPRGCQFCGNWNCNGFCQQWNNRPVINFGLGLNFNTGSGGCSRPNYGRRPWNGGGGRWRNPNPQPTRGPQMQQTAGRQQGGGNPGGGRGPQMQATAPRN
jgi:hypothetical protein